MKKLMTIAALVAFAPQAHATTSTEITSLATCFQIKAAAEAVMNARQVGLPVDRAMNAVLEDLEHADPRYRRNAAFQFWMMEDAYATRVAWTQRGRDRAIEEFAEEHYADCRGRYYAARETR